MSVKAVVPTETTYDSPSIYENTYVHDVYDSIADHFSATRYKPWPVVASFLADIPAGHIGLDAGCGNGKYLMVPRKREGQYWTIGLDRSMRLLEFAKRAKERERECVLGDVLDTPWRPGVFDFVISIATIHHLSTLERRKKSIQSILRSLSPSHGRGLIYVWSIRQDELSKRSVSLETTNPIRKGQDVFVPWVLTDSRKSEKIRSNQGSPAIEDDGNSGRTSNVFNRYYHMFDEGELRELVVSAATEIGIYVKRQDAQEEIAFPCCNPESNKCIEIVRDDWERSNYYVEFRLFLR